MHTLALAARKAARISTLRLRNATAGTHACVADEGPVVSMTSYGERIASAHLALESIAAGSLRPGRLILWLDDERAVRAPTPGLRRLIGRGLEVRHAEDDGPHKKYYPYVQSERIHRVPLVTADDDWLFPHRWLETLVRAHAVDPSTNTTHRARHIPLLDGCVAPYAEWDRIGARDASPRNLATGGWGHVMTPRMLDALRGRHHEFRATAPRADDIWLHRVAVESGTAPKSVGRYDHRHILHVPIGSGPTLAETNVDDGGNDRQVAAAWTPDVIARIAAAA